jgi:hypothetical protein
MSNLIAQVTENGNNVQIFDLGDTISIRVETPRRLSYLDVPSDAVATVIAALTAATAPAETGVRWTCPECQVTFTDPDEFAYGHDCEV